MNVKVIKSLILILVFFTPILVFEGFYEPYEFTKMIAVYLLGALAVALFLVHATLTKTKIQLPPLEINLFLLFFGISTVFSTHLYTSLWGYHLRFTGGLISLLVYLGIFLVVNNLFTNFKDKNLLLLSFVLSIIPISAAALHEKLTLQPTRLAGTFGQPNWLATYLAITLIICFYYLLVTQHKTLKLFFLTTLTLGAATLWFTYSTAGIISFLAASVLLLVLNKEKLPQNKNLLYLLVTLGLTFAAINHAIFTQKIQDIYIDLKKTYNQEITNNKISDPGFIRLHLSKTTIDLATQGLKTYLIGTGPETFPYQYQKHRSPKLNHSSEWNYLINKPHNYYLELWAQTGILSLVAHLFLIYKTLRAKHKTITPALTALFISNTFGFLTVTSSLALWTLLALVVQPKQ